MTSSIVAAPLPRSSESGSGYRELPPSKDRRLLMFMFSRVAPGKQAGQNAKQEGYCYMANNWEREEAPQKKDQGGGRRLLSAYRRSCWGQKCRHIRRVYKYDPRCNPIPSPPAKERLKKAWFVVGAIPSNESHQSPETRSAPGARAFQKWVWDRTRCMAFLQELNEE